MECYDPSTGQNTCSKGAFGVANPATLAFRYYVNLDPAEIPKAMWAETSPNGSIIWTSSGDDLLAYRSSDVSLANRGPTGPVIHAVRRLPGRGAADRGDRGRLPGGQAAARRRVRTASTRCGASTPRPEDATLEIERRICGESEGLDAMPTLNGNLHWLIAPFDPGCELTFGPTSALLHFLRAPAHNVFQVVVTNTQVGTLPGQVRATVRATFNGDPLRDVRVRFAGGAARTNENGVATVVTTLERPGRFRGVRAKGRELRALGARAGRHVASGRSALAVPRSGAG